MTLAMSVKICQYCRLKSVDLTLKVRCSGAEMYSRFNWRSFSGTKYGPMKQVVLTKIGGDHGTNSE